MAILFFCSQIVGLSITKYYLPEKGTPAKELPLNLERPEFENKDYSFIPIFIFILVATGLVLVLMRFKLNKLWKVWFFMGIFLTLTISFAAFMPHLSSFAELARQSLLYNLIYNLPAVLLALLVTSLKIFYRNPYTSNISELFVYGALAALFVPILSIMSITILLLAISVYDYIAVRKTKHMVEMAKFQTDEKVFAGLSVPYKYETGKPIPKEVKLKPLTGTQKGEMHTAILGGGDIGFPLLFAGTIMHEFNLGLLNPLTFIVPAASTIALILLFTLGSEKKFYPAMPYLTASCLVGYGILLLLI